MVNLQDYIWKTIKDIEYLDDIEDESGVRFNIINITFTDNSKIKLQSDDAEQYSSTIIIT